MFWNARIFIAFNLLAQLVHIGLQAKNSPLLSEFLADKQRIFYCGLAQFRKLRLDQSGNFGLRIWDKVYALLVFGPDGTLKKAKVTMKTNTAVHRFLTVILALCLLLPGAALAKGGKGKKNFDEGLKYEQTQQWDVAAQKYALAVSAEPNNAEYKLHYLQAVQKASLMFLKRGDELANDGDWEGAYNAYRSAYQYDQGNEIAKLKMNRMMDQQKQVASGGSAQFSTNKVGNVMNTSGELPIASKPRGRDLVPSINWSKGTKFKTVVSSLGKQLGLNVVFDDSIKESQLLVDSIELDNVTMAKALDILLRTYKCSFELIDRRTILVYADNGTNRPRFETLMVKPFYLNNITANQARAALQIVLPPGRTMAPLEAGANSSGGNVLVVKATATELQLVQDIIDAVDKSKNEVVLDVDIYEVSKLRATDIGNQLPTQNSNGYSLSNLGGAGSYLAGNGGAGLVGGVIGTSGALLALPTSQLKLLQSKGDNKLLYKTQIHVLDGQENKTTVGSSVPVRTGATYAGGIYGGGILNNNGQQGNAGGVTGALNNLLGNNGFGNGVVDNIQYKDVGLVITSTPTITSEGYVELKMEFETSDIAAAASGDPLTPTFTQRKLKSITRMQDGVTSVVAGINQDKKFNQVAGIPVVSMVPILGRFLAAPHKENNLTDIIITVTPHIVRSQGINEKDHLARAAGLQTAGPGPSVEEVVYRAQQEEEQDRRQIAQQIPQPDQINPSAPGATQAASFTQPTRNTATQQTFRPVSNNNPGVRVENVANDQPANPPTSIQQTDLLTSVLQSAPTNVPAANGVNGNNAANSAVSLSLSPKPIRQQPGKSFTVAVEVRSQSQMMGADLAISFDPSKLRVKNVRDGGMFGAQPDPTYEVANGNLAVKFKSPQSAPAMASSGRMILIEFAAIAEGASEINFNQAATQISMAGNANIKPTGTATQVIISRDGGATASQ
jgi:general secretion pathway protein D